jgi:hypothetical protein
MPTPKGNKKISGLDFQDTSTFPEDVDIRPMMSNLPPPAATAASSQLQRNKTERNRLQLLMRTDTLLSSSSKGSGGGGRKKMGLRERWNTWMINEGAKRVFFVLFLFLHLLVVVFGFLTYQLKDNSVGARAMMGVTFRELSLSFLIASTAFTDWLVLSDRSNGGTGTSRRRDIHPPSRLPELYIAPSKNPSERPNPIRQECKLPQSSRMVHRLLHPRPFVPLPSASPLLLTLTNPTHQTS